MPIEMPKGLPFSVDTFSPVSKRKRHHFLTHAHKDHTLGISTHFQFPIYSTRLTKSLLLLHCPELEESLFVEIEVGQTLVIPDPDGEFTVSAFDANHCPGAVMFLFEGSFGTLLHTGDCRLTPECVRSLPAKHVGKKGKEPRCRLDYVFLDCTFGKFSQKLPSKHSAINQVISCIWKHPEAPVVYLTCDLLGQEDILVVVSTTFGSKIFVDKAHHPEFYQSLMLTIPDIISDDPSSRFHLFDGYPKLYERAAAKLVEARAHLQPEPLIIRASAQWFACEEEYSESETLHKRKLRFNEAVRDQFGVWHVCYSMHSSREELDWALQLLAPKRVISTTPSCRAMELDYVRKHCFGARITSDDPLWKLLDISMDNTVKLEAPVKNCGSDPPVEGLIQASAESKLEAVESYSCSNKPLSFSPHGKKPSVTLFGRARLSLEDSYVSCEEIVKEDSAHTIVCKKKQDLPSQELEAEANDGSEFENVNHGKLLEAEVSRSSLCSPVGYSFEGKKVISIENKSKSKVETVVTDMQFGKKLEEELHKNSLYSSDGLTVNLGEGLKKLYRSSNVPVPRPLPSLVELMNANKRAKRRYNF